MLGLPIAIRALGDAGKRMLPTEQSGPRPEAVYPEASVAARAEASTMRATKP